MKKVVGLSLILLICLLPLAAFAQGAPAPPPGPGPAVPPVPEPGSSINPNPPPPSGRNIPPTIDSIRARPHDFAHPTESWYGVFDPKRVNTGTVVGYHEVPPQQVIIQVYVPGPGSFSGGFEPQLFEIPGYVVTETTTGYIHPARVGLREVTPGVFNWVTEPPGFQPK